ncbi:MAG: hypothetical protein R2854_19635 [Caldilineaceae bacterium]
MRAGTDGVVAGLNIEQVFTKNNRQWKGRPSTRTTSPVGRDEMEPQGILYAVSHASYLINWPRPRTTCGSAASSAQGRVGRRPRLWHSAWCCISAHTGSGEEAGIDRIAATLNPHPCRDRPLPTPRRCSNSWPGRGRRWDARWDSLKAIIDRG